MDLEVKLKIKTVIVDDEKAARDGLKYLLSYDKDIEIVSLCKLGNEAIEVINNSKPDLVFLDIQMPKIDGFQVLQAIDPEIMPVIIFVTAYDKYALKAFDVNALDYLLKPFDDEKFYKTLQKAKDFLNKSNSYELQKKILSLLNPHILENIESIIDYDSLKPQFLTRITVRQKDETLFLNVSEIDWIEASDYYVTIHANGKKYLLRETMKNFEKSLDPAKFIRIHRSVILNIERIKAIRALSNNEKMIITSDDKKFKVSRTGQRKIKELVSLKY